MCAGLVLTTLWYAVTALCAQVELKAKDKHGNAVPYHPHGTHWVDGTIAFDLPMQRLSELFNINQFIVSQTNPWVVPFLPDNDQHVADMPFNFNGIVSRLVHVSVAQLRYVDYRSRAGRVLLWYRWVAEMGGGRRGGRS